MAEKRQLAVWRGDEEPMPFTGTDAPNPRMWGVLYTRPNPDGSRKNCVNCRMWLAADQGCVLHDPDMLTPPDAVCGYHVFGDPHPKREVANMLYLDPVMSGLEQVPGGSACDRCRFYDPLNPMGGLCRAVVADASGAPAVVDALGCCARWERA